MPNLENELRKIWKHPLVFFKSNGTFTRASALNLAMRQAQGNLVYICDADISVPKNLAQLVYKNISKKTAWFPVCQWQMNEKKSQWRWFTEGTGIFAATKKQLEKTGYYDEKYLTWGKEDWELFFRFYRNGIAPRRTNCEGLYHHWHPLSQPADFVKWF